MSDVEMPDLNGIELCRLIQDMNVLVVFISSYQNYEYFRSAIQYRVEDYLLKPIKSGDILNCFGKIKEKLDLENQVKREETPTYYEQIIGQVKGYLEENYKEASLEEAAVLVNLSTSYLSMIFNEKSGL